VIVNTSSTAIKNALSVFRSGVGIYWSTASIKAKILSTHTLSPRLIFVLAVIASIACKADPGHIGISSPGKSYFESNSLTSNSTNSNNSGSST